MKKIFLFSFIATFIVSSAFARIWRVNNVAGVAADFTTAQLAHNNVLVLAGDTLHLEPSAASYGNLTMTKRLTVISIGDFLGSNPNLQYSPLTGRLDNVTINNINADSSVLHCNVTGQLNLSGVNSIRIERCHVESFMTLTNSTGISIINNFLQDITLNNTSSIIVSNNIIENNIDMGSSSSATISNNVLRAVSTNTLTVQIYNATFQNNIVNKTGLTIQFSSSIVQNNIASNTTLPAGSGNINSAVMTNIFINPLGTDDLSFRLQTLVANPAAGTGFGGIDCGAFGGTSPYKLGLQAAIPSIYKIVAPVAPSGNTINVQFSTRSNN